MFWLAETPSMFHRGSIALAYTVVPRTSARVLNDPGSKAKTKSPKTKLMGAVDWDAEGAAPWRHGPREKHAL